MLALLGCLALAGCLAHNPRPQRPPAIGSAEMAADGTITLWLIARGKGGVVGHGRFVYPPSDPKHSEIVAHVGGLEPGETKPVPPWPD